jgi:arginase family enzyme
VSEPATARAAVVAMRCRGGARGGPGARGVDQLATALGRIVGVTPRPIGSYACSHAHYRDDLEAARGCLLEAGGQLQDAVGAGVRPVLVAGDGAIAVTTLPALARLRPDARVLWLSSRASLHTPATSPDGRLAGMALAGACGRWDTGFDGAIPGERVVVCGVGELGGDERAAVAASQITVIGTALETLVYLQNALDGAPAYVHLDVDVLESGAVGAGAGTLSAEKLFDLLDAVADSCEILGLQVSGWRASAHEDAAAVAAGLVEPLLA